MKKGFLLLILLLCISHVKAITETDIMDDTNIKYKWYKEVISDELYYLKKEKLVDYYGIDKFLFYIKTEYQQVIYLSNNNKMVGSLDNSENVHVVNNDLKVQDATYIHAEDDILAIPSRYKLEKDYVNLENKVGNRYATDKEIVYQTSRYVYT